MKAKWLQTRPTDLADVHIWSRTENYKVLYSTREKKGELNEDTSMEYKRMIIRFLIGIGIRLTIRRREVNVLVGEGPAS